MARICLQSADPKLAAEWHPTKNGELTPADVTQSSSKKVWWLCSQGHVWQSNIAHRVYGTGCPECAKSVRNENRNKTIIQRRGSLKTNLPELAAEWHPTKNGELTPADVTKSSYKKVWWMCSKGHEWQTAIINRTKNGTGCPYCARRHVVPGENDLATTHSELAAEWHPTKNGELTPADVTKGSSVKVWWICTKGHEWQSNIANRVFGTGCPKCNIEGRRKGQYGK